MCIHSLFPYFTGAIANEHDVNQGPGTYLTSKKPYTVNLYS